ncbi:MAG: M16 family metallopeptidase [Candidatus Eiseniibacteriota bacterium]
MRQDTQFRHRIARGTRHSGSRASALTVAASALILALTQAAPGVAAPAASAQPPMIKLDFEKYTLPNGLEVILRRDTRIPISAVNLWYHVGPANETPGLTGFAHLFEHMMFQGSVHVGDDQHFKLLEAAGASMINGTTDFDRTNYMEDVPSNQLELALWLESDRMGYLLETLDQAKLSNQQDVVRNERRQSVENAPYGLVEEELWHQLYPKAHPYYASVIGSHEDIQNAKLGDVRDFFKRYYAPNNASLAIVGDIDIAKTKSLVEKYFGPLPKGEPVPAITATTPPITAERRAVVTDKVELPRVYMAWITQPIFKPGDAEAVVLARILGGGKASRLYKSLVYEKKIAQSAIASQQALKLGSVFQITATAKPGHTADEIEQAVWAEVERMAQTGPTADELAAAKTGIYSDIVSSLEQLGGFSGVADRLNLYNQHTGDPGYLNKDLARYAAVTADGVKNVAATELAKNKRVVVYGIPGEKKIPAAPATPPAVEKTTQNVESKVAWRKEAPKPGPLPTAPLPKAESFKLENGLTVYVVESHSLPLIAGQLVVRSGSAADPVDRPGLAGYTAAMLDEGTSKHDALQIANEVEALGGSLGSNSGTDGSYVFWRSLKDRATAMTDLAAEVVLEPSFPATDIERVRNDRLTSILQQKDSPFQTAFKVMFATMYGEKHPYGHVPLGNDEAVKAITRDEIVNFYRSSYAPQNAALVLAGDVTVAEAKTLAQKAFGTWRGTATEAPRPGAPTSIPERVVIVDTPGSPQTVVGVAQIGVARSDPNYERINVMNQVLGGLFASRVNMNLREKHGYSYGAFSFQQDNRGPGPFVVGAAVRSDVTGPSVDEMLKEVKGMQETPVTADELFLAKESVSRSLPALFETTNSTVGTIGQLYLFELPTDYYAQLPSRISSMTAGDVQNVAKEFLKPENMKVIAVGDRSAIQPQIEKLKLGDITYRGADAKPLAVTQ